MLSFLDEIQEISTEGFQVVPAEMFQAMQHVNTPCMTIWSSRISFNKEALTALNTCERVRLEVNAAKKMILLIPVTQKDKDNLRWMKPGKQPQTRRMDCAAFTSRLYKSWGWDKGFVFRTTGRIVTADKKVMLLFDFNDAEKWKFGGSEKGQRS